MNDIQSATSWLEGYYQACQGIHILISCVFRFNKRLEHDTAPGGDVLIPTVCFTNKRDRNIILFSCIGAAEHPFDSSSYREVRFENLSDPTPIRTEPDNMAFL